MFCQDYEFGKKFRLFAEMATKVAALGKAANFCLYFLHNIFLRPLPTVPPFSLGIFLASPTAIFARFCAVLHLLQGSLMTSNCLIFND